MVKLPTDLKEGEILKDICRSERRYAITNFGRVWSYPKGTTNKKGIWLSLAQDKDGYLTIYIKINKKIKIRKIHRLVATHFIDNPNSYMDVNHKNGIKTNNAYYNLEWCTKSENLKHAWDNGLKASTDKMRENCRLLAKKQRKLTFNQAEEIRKLYSETDILQKEIANRYGVSITIITSIINNKKYLHV